MKGGAQAALALGIGYVLGRRRKMSLTAKLALGAAAGGVARLGPTAVRQGAKYLGKTDVADTLGPQVTEIVNTIRGDLLDASKAAAATAVTSRLDSLCETLHKRAETLRNPEAAAGEAGESTDEALGRARETVGSAREAVGRGSGSAGRLRRRGRGADREEEAGFDQNEERGAGRVRRERPQPKRFARREPDEAEEPEDEYEEEEPAEEEPDEAPSDDAGELDEEEAEEPAPRRRRTTRPPVVRTRR
jgi:hypothetical protein